jgi:hypothetical protein
MRRFSNLLRIVVLPVVLAVAIAAPAAAATTSASSEPTPTVVVAGSGTLAAKGTGDVRLAGSYVLNGSMDGGSLKVTGVTRWTVVRVSSWESKTRLADGSLLFRGVHGSFHIAGRSIATAISSPLVRFAATGHGRAHLVGTGIFYVNGHGPFRWADGGVNPAF